MSLLNLCLIDDDDVYRATLAKSLERLNCGVRHFPSPQQAIDSLTANKQPLPSVKERQPLIFLLDLKLEHTSGLCWIRQIKDLFPDCRILLVTGYASISTAVEAIKLGAENYLPKPITAREVIAHLTDDKAQNEPVKSFKPMSVERLEWEHINKVLEDNQGNISASARALGMHRRTLQRKLAKKPVKH